PSAISVCLRHLPLRGASVRRPGPAPDPAADRAAFRATFASDVREYLERSPRQLPSKYFYDDLGSSLFEAICRLPWYRITRVETAMLARHAAEIFEGLPEPVSLAELGCGGGEKLATLAEAS